MAVVRWKAPRPQLRRSPSTISRELRRNAATRGGTLQYRATVAQFGLFKTEAIDRQRASWTGWRDIERAVASWVHWYNHQRLHFSIHYLPPAEYEHLYHQSTTGHRDPAAA